MPKKELIQTAESMEDDSVAEDKRLEGKGKLPRTLDGCEREWNCVFWSDSQDIICTYAAKRKTSVWAGLGYICEKIRTLWVPRSLLLGLSALLGSTLRGELPAYRESEFKPWSKTSSLGSIVLFTAEVAGQGHWRQVVTLLPQALHFCLLTTAVLHLLYTTLLKLPLFACVTVRDLIFFVFKSDGKIVSPARTFPVLTVQPFA